MEAVVVSARKDGSTITVSVVSDALGRFAFPAAACSIRRPSGSMLTDRVSRLDIKSGQYTEYMLPRPTNIRRVYMDDSKRPGTLWIGSNHGASIVKVEPLD